MDGEIYSEKVCPMCGTRFTVLWPQQWAYKRGKPNPKFFCSWKCFREIERREKDMKRAKITLEDKKKAVQIALDGGDPVKFLQGKGAADAVQVWGRIKRDLKETDPETFGKLPKRAEKKAPEKAEEPETVTVKDAMDGMKAAADEFFGKCEDAGLKMDGGKEFFQGFVRDMSEYQITAIRIKDFGEFYYDREHGTVDWRTLEGEEVSVPTAGWKELIERLPTILEILGVK